tara:strand:+ start:311494 stop:312024 length:531 start_codon:yes stop_codon:yes gene_type:complete
MMKFLIGIVILAAGAAVGWFFLMVLPAGKQKQTVAMTRNVGTAWMYWLTDEVGDSSSGSNVNAELMTRPETQIIFDANKKLGGAYRKLDYDDMTKLLKPRYLQDVPRVDGWGNELEFYLSDNLLNSYVMLVRSPGSDGKFSGNTYTMGAFDSKNAAEDIVWADGYFVRWPEQSRAP